MFEPSLGTIKNNSNNQDLQEEDVFILKKHLFTTASETPSLQVLHNKN